MVALVFRAEPKQAKTDPSGYSNVALPQPLNCGVDIGAVSILVLQNERLGRRVQLRLEHMASRVKSSEPIRLLD